MALTGISGSGFQSPVHITMFKSPRKRMPYDPKYASSRSTSCLQKGRQYIGRDRAKWARMPDPVYPNLEELQIKARLLAEERRKKVDEMLGRTKNAFSMPINAQQPLAGSQCLDSYSYNEPMDLDDEESPNEDPDSDDWIDDESDEEDELLEDISPEAMQPVIDKAPKVDGPKKKRSHYETRTQRNRLWDDLVAAATGQFALIERGKLPCNCKETQMLPAISFTGMGHLKYHIK
jgi:hypothetical protein